MNIMIQQLYALGNVLKPGITLTKAEIISWYRSLKSSNDRVINMLSSFQFFKIGKTDNGTLFIC